MRRDWRSVPPHKNFPTHLLYHFLSNGYSSNIQLSTWKALDSCYKGSYINIPPKLKFIIGNKIIVVDGEEDILASHLSYFRYIDVDGETIETPFKALEVASVVAIHPMAEHRKSEPSTTYWK